MENLHDFYEQVFDLEFLIEYGYYDRDVKLIDESNSEMQHLYAVSDHFYPKYFSMEDLVQFLNDKNLNATVDDNYNITYDSDNILGSENTWTEPIIFTIPKKNDISIRRTYKMPNIFSYSICQIKLELS